MKTNLTARSSLLALLMVGLLLSSPLVTLAQQISAEVQAKQDAKGDVNKVKWFTVGYIGCASGGVIAVLNDETEAPIRVPLGVSGMIMPVLPIVYAASASSVPPTERLLGKSPAYLNVYVDNYAKELKRQRVIFSAAGCGAGTLSGAIILGVRDLQLF